MIDGDGNMAEGKPVFVRLKDDEYRLLERLKDHLGLRHDTEVIRHALRLAYQHYFPEERPQR